MYLSQHLIILHVVHLIGTDLPLQSVLVEFTTDVDQQSGGAGVNGAAHRDVADVPGNVDAVAQDHANKNAWAKRQKKEAKKIGERRQS